MSNLDLNGFLVINKPTGMTSFDVIRVVKIALKGNKFKIGHIGTLDPLATGVLVLVFGKALKLVEFLVGLDKEYIYEMKLGYVSDSYDSDGEIKFVSDSKVSESKVREVIKGFNKTYMQMPPKFSAKKINGIRAYDLARKGKDVNLKAKEVTIYNSELLEFKEDIVKGLIKCSSGTYIRSIINEMGEELGVGAHMISLDRVKLGSFDIKNSVSLPKFKDFDDVNERKDEFSDLFVNNILDFNNFIDDIFSLRIDLNDDEYTEIKFGRKIKRNDIFNDFIACYYNGSFVSILKQDEEGRLCVHKNFI